METYNIAALILGLLFLSCMCVCVCKGKERNRITETEEEEAAAPAVIVPSAPVVAPVEQATIGNTAFMIEENEQAQQQITDLPPAYEDLFVK